MYQSSEWHTITGCESQTVQDFMLHTGKLRPEWKKEGTCLSLNGGVDGSPRLTEGEQGLFVVRR